MGAVCCRQWCRSLVQAVPQRVAATTAVEAKEKVLSFSYFLALSLTAKQKGAKPVELLDFSPLGAKDKDEFMSVGKALKHSKMVMAVAKCLLF